MMRCCCANGLLKWWWDERIDVSYSSHSGLSDDAMAQLVADDTVEVLEHSETVEQTDIGEMPAHDLRIRRIAKKGEIKVAAVPRERFLIHPDAVTLADSLLTGEKTRVTRSDLVAMGYDRKVVEGLTLSGEDDVERAERRDFVSDTNAEAEALELVDYYDLFVRFDMDGDGIAELHHMCFAGGLGERNLLLDEECDEVQYCDLKVMAQPHQWEGISLADDMKDIQRTKTVLMRQTLDNIYWQNSPQPVMQEGAVKNEDAVFNPEFGLPIRVREGVDARAAMSFLQVPFVARDSFAMLSYLDEEMQDRTGITDAASGLAPDALQNMTAKASAMIEQAGIGQIELMVRTLAEGLRVFFSGLLRLIIKHSDRPRVLRLKGEWVEYDPRHWNAAMDCTVNTGLGTGTRERDMAVMQSIIGLQERIVAGLGPDNPFVKPENVWNVLSKLVEAAGIKTPDLFFTEPDQQEVEARLQATRNKPDPEQQKMQAQMQLEQAKLQVDMQKSKMQADVARDKERAQMEADLNVEQARIEADGIKQQRALAADAALLDKKLAFEREKLAVEREDVFMRYQADLMSKAQQQEAN